MNCKNESVEHGLTEGGFVVVSFMFLEFGKQAHFRFLLEREGVSEKLRKNNKNKNLLRR